jgi:hypothetical protein
MNVVRSWLLRRLLTAPQRMVLAALAEPARWQPDDAINPPEAAEWGKLLSAPILRKIDAAMVNMANQEAQRAITAPSAETLRMAGYALGFRAAWQTAKALSTITAAEGGATEGDDSTASAALAHLSP